MIKLFAAVVTAAVFVAATATACGSGGSAGRPTDGTIGVVTGFYPLQYAAQQVGGSHVTVTNLTKPGAEPHDVELTPADVGTVSLAALAIHEKGLQPAVDEAISAQNPSAGLDVAAAADLTLTIASGGDHHAEQQGEQGGQQEGEQDGQHDSGGEQTDPHFWLDPTRYAAVVAVIATRLGELDPANRADYQRNAAAFTATLTALDRDFSSALTTCTNRYLVTSHAAFGYLAARYGFTQVAITGLAPDAEPAPARLAEVSRIVADKKVTTLYAETLVSPAVSQAVARETGAATAVLDPIEGIGPASAGSDYVSIMRANLATLTAGQGCS